MSGSAPRHIPSLDGLRAISFLLVFVSHAGLGHIVPGGFGVTVFFFLSGYLITTLLRTEVEEHGAVDYGAFYLRRALRILPPFYLVLALAMGATLLGWSPGELRWPPVIAQLGHVTNYWIVYRGIVGLAAGTGVYWSLAIEEHFYLLFPWLYAALYGLTRSRGWRAGILLSLCVAVLVWRCILVFGLHAETNRTYLATDTRFDSLLFGCALATYGNPALDRPREPAGNLWRFVLLPLALLALIGSFIYRNEAFRESFRYSIQGLALIPVFVVAIRDPGWGVLRLLNHRRVAFIGTLSYSLYLVHHAVLASLEFLVTWPALVRGVAGLAISFTLAYAMYVFVERPCAVLRRRFARAPTG